MLDQYAHFLAVGTSTSAGFGGLLFVSLSVANRDEHESRTRERRTILAASAFLALVDVFFVSIVSSLGGSVLFATTNLVLAMVGLAGTSRLALKGKRAGNYARGIPKRNLNFAFTGVAAGGFATQLGLAVALLLDAHNTALLRALVFVLVAFLASALARAWEVAGIGRRSPHLALAPADESQGAKVAPVLQKLGTGRVTSRGSTRSRRDTGSRPSAPRHASPGH